MTLSRESNTLAQLEASLKPSTRRVLNRLRQGPQTTHSLCQGDVGGTRFGARLGELRKAGWVWREERLPLPTRGSRYELLAEPEGFPHRAAPLTDGGYARDSTGRGPRLTAPSPGGGGRAECIGGNPAAHSHATEIPGVGHAGEGRPEAELASALQPAAAGDPLAPAEPPALFDPGAFAPPALFDAERAA